MFCGSSNNFEKRPVGIALVSPAPCTLPAAFKALLMSHQHLFSFSMISNLASSAAASPAAPWQRHAFHDPPSTHIKSFTMTP